MIELRSNKKGGRPPKLEKRSEQLAVLCTLNERMNIAQKAEAANMSISEFLRNTGLHQKVVVKSLPKEVLGLIGTINHIAANMNQIAKKRNMNEELNAIERATLNSLSGELHHLVKIIQEYLK